MQVPLDLDAKHGIFCYRVCGYRLVMEMEKRRCTTPRRNEFFDANIHWTKFLEDKRSQQKPQNEADTQARNYNLPIRNLRSDENRRGGLARPFAQ